MQRWLKQIARQRVMGFQLIEAKWVAVYHMRSGIPLGTRAQRPLGLSSWRSRSSWGRNEYSSRQRVINSQN